MAKKKRTLSGPSRSKLVERKELPVEGYDEGLRKRECDETWGSTRQKSSETVARERTKIKRSGSGATIARSPSGGGVGINRLAAG